MDGVQLLGELLLDRSNVKIMMQVPVLMQSSLCGVCMVAFPLTKAATKRPSR